MNFNFIQEFLADYSVFSIAVAILVSVVFIILEKVLSKIPRIIKSYLPMLLSVLLTVLIDYLISPKCFDVKESLVLGLVSGSLSLAFTSFFRKKDAGEQVDCSILELSLLEILKDFTDKTSASVIAKEIEKIEETTEHELNQKITELLDIHLQNKVEPEELFLLKNLIIATVGSLKESTNL